MLPIGERIRSLRRDRNETQEELALVLGVSYQAVSRWENGDAYPDIELLPKLAAHYEVTTDELLGADEETRKTDKERRKQEFRDEISRCIRVKDRTGILSFGRKKGFGILVSVIKIGAGYLYSAERPE